MAGLELVSSRGRKSERRRLATKGTKGTKRNIADFCWFLFVPFVPIVANLLRSPVGGNRRCLFPLAKRVLQALLERAV